MACIIAVECGKAVIIVVCYVSLCEGLHAKTGSLCSIVHVDCTSLSMIVIKNVLLNI